LGDEVVRDVNRQLSIGIDAQEITGYLKNLGHKATQREVFTHKQHADIVPDPVSNSRAYAVEVIQTVKEEVHSLGAGLTLLELENNLMMRFLRVTDMLLGQAEETGSIRVARVAVETGNIAYNIMKNAIARPSEDDKNINITIHTESLEEDMLRKHYNGTHTLSEAQLSSLLSEEPEERGKGTRSVLHDDTD
jgi:hypothetical protein